MRTLVADRWGPVSDGARHAAFPNGAGVADGRQAWVLAEDQPGRALGAAIAWAIRQGAAELHLLLSEPAAGEQVAAVQARRASLFVMPVDVWLVAGRELRAVGPDTAEPLPFTWPAELDEFAERLRAAGAEPVYEHGVLAGDVLGLEVARVVPAGPAGLGGGWRLSVGVGKYDREIHETLLAGDEGAALDAALRRVVAGVSEERRPGRGAHPANRLAPERWLRAIVLAHPGLVGALQLEPVATTEPREDLRQPAPAAARGIGEEGEPLLAVCTAGIVDLHVVPVAADTRLALGGPRLVIAVDPSADSPVTRDLAAALRDPAEVATVPADWRGLPA